MPEHEDDTSNRDIDLAAIAAARELESAVKDHPTAEELIALQEDRLGAERAEQIRAHLVLCPGCLDDLERLDAFDGDGDGDAPVVEPEATEASWQRFQRRIAEPAAGSGWPPSDRRSGHWPWWTLAASLLLAAIGIGALLLALQPGGKPGIATAGAHHPLLFDLLPQDGAVFRGATGVEVIEVPADTDVLVARLLLGDQTHHPGYTARLENSEGRTVWSQGGIRRQASGTFVLLIPRAAAPPGTYALHLLSQDADGPRRLATYEFRLQNSE